MPRKGTCLLLRDVERWRMERAWQGRGEVILVAVDMDGPPGTELPVRNKALRRNSECWNT
jgi:hypothetical protein